MFPRCNIQCISTSIHVPVYYIGVTTFVNFVSMFYLSCNYKYTEKI